MLQQRAGFAFGQLGHCGSIKIVCYERREKELASDWTYMVLTARNCHYKSLASVIHYCTLNPEHSRPKVFSAGVDLRERQEAAFGTIMSVIGTFVKECRRRVWYVLLLLRGSPGRERLLFSSKEGEGLHGEEDRSRD